MSWASPCFLAGWIWFGSRPGSSSITPGVCPSCPHPIGPSRTMLPTCSSSSCSTTVPSSLSMLCHHAVARSMTNCLVLDSSSIHFLMAVNRKKSEGSCKWQCASSAQAWWNRQGHLLGGSASMKWFLWYPCGRVKREPFSAQSSFFPSQQTTTAIKKVKEFGS